MKNKILFLVAVVGIFAFGLPAFASISYSRTPSGTEITSPVNFNVALDSFEDLGCGANEPYWNLIIVDSNDEWYYEPDFTVASTILEFHQNRPVELGSYKEVSPICCLDSNCNNFNGGGIWFEGGQGETIFSVVSGEPTPPPASASLISLPSGFVNGMLAWVGNAFTDLAPLIVIFIGLPLAFWGISRVIGLFRFSKARKDD